MLTFQLVINSGVIDQNFNHEAKVLARITTTTIRQEMLL
jgi:hypothetical protein